MSSSPVTKPTTRLRERNIDTNLLSVQVVVKERIREKVVIEDAPLFPQYCTRWSKVLMPQCIYVILLHTWKAKISRSGFIKNTKMLCDSRIILRCLLLTYTSDACGS